jgi:glutaredoxin
MLPAYRLEDNAAAGRRPPLIDTIHRSVARSGRKTTPKVFVNGPQIGGADELESWLARQPTPKVA